MNRSIKLILLGAPGAGKGTQAEILSDKLGIPTVSTGNIIRSAIRNQTPLGLKAKSYVDSGGLVPDMTVVQMLQEYLRENNCIDGYILDGFPRNVQQAQTLENMGISIDHVVNLCVDDDTIQERLGGRKVCADCGSSYHIKNKPPQVENICDSYNGALMARRDDTPETICERLRVYHEATEPLVHYYGEKGILSMINGSCNVSCITNQILDMVTVAVR